MDINPVIVQQHLKGMDYPAKTQDLINKAKQEGADQQVCSALEQLPENRDFQSAADVSQALGLVL